MPVKMVSIGAVGRRHHKLIRRSVLRIGSLELLRHRRRKPVVVLGINPQHGQVAVFVRRLAKDPEGVDHARQVAVVFMSVAAAPACKTDGGLQARRRVGRERHLRKAPGGNTHTQDSAGIHLGQTLRKLHHGTQIHCAGLAGLIKASMARTAAAIGAVLLSARLAITLADHDDRDISTSREPQGLRELRPGRHAHALLRVCGRAMREQHQRMLARKREVDFQHIEAVGEHPRRRHKHFLLHQAKHLLRRIGLRSIGCGGRRLPCCGKTERAKNYERPRNYAGANKSLKFLHGNS